MRRVQLGKTLDFFNGKAVSAEESGKYPVYGSNGVIGFTAKHKYENSIVIGRVGAYCGSINYERGKYWASDNTIVADTKSEYSIEFLSFLLKALPLNSLAGGSAQPLLNQTILSRIEASIPDLREQKKVAAILSAYDELIENNQRRIALLEKMAEEIYREWFVRLRFPSYEKVRFVKGLPADWDIKRVKEIVTRKQFGRIYREAELFDGGQVVVIDQSRVDCLGYHDGEAQHLASPDSPILLFGDHSCKMILMTKPFSLAENVIPFDPKPNVSPYFLFHLVKDLARTTEYKRHWTDLTNREVLVPKESLQVEFENAAKHNHEQIEVLQQVVRKAEKVRNLLLPRLISGQLSVENLDIQFPLGMEKSAYA